MIKFILMIALDAWALGISLMIFWFVIMLSIAAYEDIQSWWFKKRREIRNKIIEEYEENRKCSG